MYNNIQEYNHSQSESDRKICELFNKIIDSNLIGTESKIWHGHPVWFLEGNPIVGYHKLKNSIRLLFWSGQSFKEKDLLPEGTFKAAEITYTDCNQIIKSDLQRWLKKSKDIHRKNSNYSLSCSFSIYR